MEFSRSRGSLRCPNDEESKGWENLRSWRRWGWHSRCRDYDDEFTARKIFIDGHVGTTGLRIHEMLSTREDLELIAPPSSLFLATYLGVLILFCWMRLETRVEPDGVCVQFFPLHRRSVRIEVDPTHAVEAVMYSPLREYGGWGIRHGLGGRGLAYTVSRNWGVRLRQPDGGALLIGSQRAEDLADAIRTHCAGMPSRPSGKRTRI